MFKLWFKIFMLKNWGILFLAFPSLQVLYLIEENLTSALSIKIYGHQWYWTYEYENFNFKYDSFLNSSLFRLLDVDKALVLPYITNFRLLITSNDVIHSWTLPSTGIKIDANPGRLNLFNLFRFWAVLINICSIFNFELKWSDRLNN